MRSTSDIMTDRTRARDDDYVHYVTVTGEEKTCRDDDIKSTTDRSSGKFTRIGCLKDAVHIRLPAIMTSIPESAFEGCENLKSISGPGITKISGRAFHGCKNLESADFPAATSVGYDAFFNNRALKSLDMPKLRSADTRAFQYCVSLNRADMPMLSSIGESGFEFCSRLEAVDFPLAGSVGKSAFGSCRSLRTASLPRMEYCETECFKGCGQLGQVDLSSVSVVAFHAFDGCGKLADLDLPSVDTIRTEAFAGSSVRNVSMLNAGLIEARAFEGCGSVEAVDMTNVKEVGRRAFRDCPNLREVKSGCLGFIGEGAFSYCPSLESVPAIRGVCYTTVDDRYNKRDHVCSVDEFFKAARGGLDIKGGFASVERVYLPDHVTEIPDDAFRNAPKLGFISGKGVVSIGARAFEDRGNLYGVNFPAAQSIGPDAFRKCAGIKEVVMPDATSIGPHAFDGCIRLETAHMPLLSKINYDAFAGCEKLKTGQFAGGCVRVAGHEDRVPGVLSGMPVEPVSVQDMCRMVIRSREGRDNAISDFARRELALQDAAGTMKPMPVATISVSNQASGPQTMYCREFVPVYMSLLMNAGGGSYAPSDLHVKVRSDDYAMRYVVSSELRRAAGLDVKDFSQWLSDETAKSGAKSAEQAVRKDPARTAGDTFNVRLSSRRLPETPSGSGTGPEFERLT